MIVIVIDRENTRQFQIRQAEAIAMPLEGVRTRERSGNGSQYPTGSMIMNIIVKRVLHFDLPR